jgi:mono/diheme cytochrome c family protein
MSGAAVAALLVCVTPAGATQANTLERGRAIYLRECASCHGDGATGYGPLSWLLPERPPDLTRLQNRTTPFPREPVRNTITGRVRLAPSHWPSQMPKWREFADVDALLDYLQSIQRIPYGRYQGPTHADLAAAGATLYKSYCATCHEPGASEPNGYVIGVAPPDLSTLRIRHAQISTARIVELISRCDEDDDTWMPAWSRTFERRGWPGALTIRNLEALAHYIDSIQR